MKKVKVIVILLALAIFFVGVIPIIINETYKYGSLHGGYITMWNAADVLSYYGTALGATATATAMVATITFTRKQIDRENYLKSEREKWSKIEAVFVDALNKINPMFPLVSTMDGSFSDPTIAINVIQKYQIGCKLATDQLNAYLNIADYPKVKKLINEIIRASEQFHGIYQEEVEVYTQLRNFRHRDAAKKTLDMEAKHPNSFSKEEIAFCEKNLSETNELRLEDIQESITKINEKIISAYHSTYRGLLQLKGSTFEIINTEIQKEADNILHLWGKK